MNATELKNYSERIEIFLDKNLVNDAAFASPAIVVAHMRGCTQGPQAHLARCVAAQHRAVLHQYDAQPLTRGGDGAADACQPASYYDEIAVELLEQRTAAFGMKWLS